LASSLFFEQGSAPEPVLSLSKDSRPSVLRQQRPIVVGVNSLR